MSIEAVGGTSFAAVITTIQAPTPAVTSLVARLAECGGRLYVAGDRKGPASFDLPNTTFMSLATQEASGFTLAARLPVGHYARKNIAYLQAISDGMQAIYETDDDNCPLASWQVRSQTVTAQTVDAMGWVNVYSAFSRERIWPRGMPLDALLPFDAARIERGDVVQARAPVQQGLANGSPDVDAVWRLVLDQPIEFDDAPSLVLGAGSWCPFNSQSTWWWPEAFPLLYLPSHCSFRMTDIWRSFIAQRCLWALGVGVVFHGAEVFQDRNEHVLMRDFTDEVPGYLRNRELVAVLEALELEPGVGQVSANLRRCYEALVQAGFFPEIELELLQAWCHDLREACVAA